MRIFPTLSAAALAVALCTAGCSSMMPGAAAPAKTVDGMLVGAGNGMTLYTFDRDPADGSKSVCNGPCANNWPPLLADEGAKPSGDYGIVARDDGRRQWTLKGKPLYFFVKDQKAGDKVGDGFLNNAWHVARP